MSEQFNYLMAGNSKASAKLLELLASTAWPRVRMRVAENPNCPIHVLALLCQDDDPEVRMSVTNNPKVTLGILEQLASDQSADVRFYLAEDQSLPRTLLCKLSEDENPFVARRAQLTMARAARAELFNEPKFSSAANRQSNVGGSGYEALWFFQLISRGINTKPVATY